VWNGLLQLEPQGHPAELEVLLQLKCRGRLLGRPGGLGGFVWDGWVGAWVGGLQVRGGGEGDCKRHSGTEALVHAGSYINMAQGIIAELRLLGA